MVRIDFLIFGYRRVTLPDTDMSRVASLLLRKKIPFVTVDAQTLLIKERDAWSFESILSSASEARISEPLGIFGAVRRFPYKLGLTLGLVLSLLLVILASLPVWDVRVRGNEKIPESAVEEVLLECGFGVGSLWHTTDLCEVETKFLSLSDGISWVNVNRRGGVAYVEIIEMKPEDTAEKPDVPQYSNIIAEYDCVIEEITVKRGRGEVKPGDTVRAGEVLISGVLPPEAGGGLCRAEGVVLARVYDTVSAEVDRSYEKITEKRHRLISIDLKIFNFSANIFKIYGNDTEECDIIEQIDSFSLLGKCKLPFEVERRLIVERSTEVCRYTDEELVFRAAGRLDAALSVMLDASDLLARKTYGSFTDRGYRMSSDIVYLTEVGQEAELEFVP